jgi:diguanylate cyclase (GGDEF)-like protein
MALTLRPKPLPLPILFGFAAVACISAAIGVAAPTHALLALGLCAWWCICCCWRFGTLALAILIPTLALIPGSTPWLLLIWSLVALLAMVIANSLERAPDQERLRELRNELRDSEHGRKLLHQHIQRYPVLLEACLELSNARDLDQLAEGLCQRARKLVPNVHEVLVFLGTATDQRCCASSDGSGEPCAREAGDNERYVAAEARSLHQREGNRIRVLIPLRGDRQRADHSANISEAERTAGLGNQLRGVLEVVFDTNNLGDQLSLELLSALGRLGGLGLAAVELLNQARSLALHDELTGLYGQHEFLRRLDEQSSLCERNGTTLGLLMCDMDRLKQFNDEFGHQAGDIALTCVADALRNNLPPNAVACRYGGEEFAVFVLDTDQHRLLALADRLRMAIETTEFPEHPERNLTASLGVTMRKAGETARAALARADDGCYRAKAKGRNRVALS